MKKLLIIGASVLQLPAIKKAKEMGFYVGVADYDPKAIGIKYADEFFNVSTIDIEGITKAAKEFSPDGIMTLATDMPMRSIASATKELGLPGISMETAIKSTDKGEMIKAFKEKGVPSPWFYIIENEDEFEKVKKDILFPCVIKPIDNSGSRGVVFSETREEIDDAYKYSVSQSRDGAVIIEEYLEGKEVSVEVIVLDGIPHIIQVTDKVTTGKPYFVEIAHSQPSSFAKSDIDKIENVAAKAVKAVGILNGPAHVEMIMTKNGPIMVELGARLGGDCIASHLVPLSTGIDMVEATINIACGIKPDITPKFNKGSAIRYFTPSAGVIEDITGIEPLKNEDRIKEVFLAKKTGDSCDAIHSSMDRVGFAIAQGESAVEAIDILENAVKSVAFKTRQKRVMILGAGFLQSYVLKKAKDLGYYTIAVDMNPDAVGFKYCDEYEIINIVDEEKCLQYAKKMKIDGVLTAATDYGVLSMSCVGNELELPSINYEAAKRIKNKYQVRKRLSDANADDTGMCYEISSEDEIDNIEKSIRYPVMVKPCDGSGSRGASKANDCEEFKKACVDAMNNSLTHRALAEPFIYGDEYGVESFVYNGEVNVLGIMKKEMTKPPYYAELGHSLPSGLSLDMELKIKNCVITAIKALDINFGSVNMDLLITASGDVHIVDIGARMGGNLIGSHIIPNGTGINYIENMIKAAVGDAVSFKPCRPSRYVATKILALMPGKVKGLPDFAALEKEYNVKIEHHLCIGDEVREYHNNLDGCGYVVAVGDDMKQTLENAENAYADIDYNIVRS